MSESADRNQAQGNSEECLFFGLNVILAKEADWNANSLLICTHSTLLIVDTNQLCG